MFLGISRILASFCQCDWGQADCWTLAVHTCIPAVRHRITVIGRSEGVINPGGFLDSQDPLGMSGKSSAFHKVPPEDDRCSCPIHNAASCDGGCRPLSARSFVILCSLLRVCRDRDQTYHRAKQLVFFYSNAFLHTEASGYKRSVSVESSNLEQHEVYRTSITLLQQAKQNLTLCAGPVSDANCNDPCPCTNG